VGTPSCDAITKHLAAAAAGAGAIVRYDVKVACVYMLCVQGHACGCVQLCVCVCAVVCWVWGCFVPTVLQDTDSNRARQHATAAHRCRRRCCRPQRAAQVAKAAYDASSAKWVLEGAVRSPLQVMADVKAQPPYKPWNLGVFDALVLADKMTGCPGARC
jgi:hypothetical protein